jgi:hypothetical protein
MEKMGEDKAICFSTVAMKKVHIFLGILLSNLFSLFIFDKMIDA